MRAPLVFLDTESTTERTCEGCGTPFTADYPSSTKRFCGKSCSNRAIAQSRTGERNSRWNNGAASHPLYETYLQMKGRCQSSTHPRWASYGGRGITVCQRWDADFWTFVQDMGPRPGELSLDRIDNDAGYSPSNCRWATASEQSKNRRELAYAGSRKDPNTGRFISGASE